MWDGRPFQETETERHGKVPVSRLVSLLAFTGLIADPLTRLGHAIGILYVGPTMLIWRMARGRSVLPVIAVGTVLSGLGSVHGSLDARGGDIASRVMGVV